MARLKKKKRISVLALSQLPLRAGSALAAAAGRGFRWGFSHYARAPLANTSIAALTVFTAMAGSNALYFQQHRHPAPLFGPAPDYVAGLPDPVTPAVRRNSVTLAPIVVIDETTGSIRHHDSSPAVAQPTSVEDEIESADVIALQQKLTRLGLYYGKVDGVFGPKTAGAIRRFEERAGLAPKGELTQDVLDAVADAPVVTPQATAAPMQNLAILPAEPVVQPAQPIILVPMPAATTAVASTEVTGSVAPANTGAVPPATIGNPAAPEDQFQPLPNPAPLQLSLQAAAQPRTIAPHRDLPDSPREALNIVVATAKNGIQALASVIENGPQLGPSNTQAVQVAPVPVSQTIAPQPQPQQPVETASIQPQSVEPAALQQPMPPLATTIAPAETLAAPAPVVVADVTPVEAVPQVSDEPMTDRQLVEKIQRGLTSLGFLRGEIDGVAGEATAKAIRNFEVYYNYDVTGRVSPGLVDLLVAAGASI